MMGETCMKYFQIDTVVGDVTLTLTPSVLNPSDSADVNKSVKPAEENSVHRIERMYVNATLSRTLSLGYENPQIIRLFNELPT
jgi:hypothetical protein